MTSYKILGTNDDKDTCQCCGKTNLKRVVWLVEVDSDGNDISEPMHAGTTCAAYKMLGDKKRQSTVKIDSFATWTGKGHDWLARGYSMQQVYDAIRMKSGLHVELRGNAILFVDRQTFNVAAEIRA